MSMTFQACKLSNLNFMTFHDFPESTGILAKSLLHLATIKWHNLYGIKQQYGTNSMANSSNMAQSLVHLAAISRHNLYGIKQQYGTISMASHSNMAQSLAYLAAIQHNLYCI